MATYNIPYQNLSFNVPDAGEVYKLGDDPNGAVYYRSPTDNKIYGTSLEQIGQQYAQQKGAQQVTNTGSGYTYSLIFPDGNKQVVDNTLYRRLGEQALKEQGIDYNTLKTRSAANQADINSVMQFGGNLTDLSLLKSTPTQTGETITKSISSVNPQGADVSSSLYGSLEKSKSLMENLLNAGATQQQAQSLTGSAQAGKPFTTQNLTTAGVTTPKPVPTTIPAQTSPTMTPYTVSRGTATSTNLPSTSSIVDFLKAQGMDSSFQARKAMYEKLGLTDRLGDFVGSAQQNTRLLDILKNQGTTAAQPQTAPEVKDANTKATTGVSASDLFPGLFSSNSTATKSEAELVNDWLTSPEGKLFLDKQNLTAKSELAKAEATKQELEAKYAQEKTSLENKLADNGLAFSGIRGTEVKALADALAASTLGVDRELASNLLNANLDLREAILKGVADLAKNADAGRKEAIQQLNAIGYAVIDGKLVPTLAAQSAARAETSLQLSEKRLQLAEDKTNSGTSGNKITMAEAVSRGLPTSVVGLSEQDVANSFYSSVAPDWFVQKVETERQQNVLPSVMQNIWDNYRTKFIEPLKVKTPTPTIISMVKNMRNDGVPEDEVTQFIQFSGFDPENQAFK